jgi:S1-C subfamily serine protease
VLFPYPHPKTIGLILDPNARAQVKEVVPDPLAAKAGFQTGDIIQTLNSQPLLSMADVQWVLHQTPATGGKLIAQVERKGQTKELTVTLASGWRRTSDITWRSSSWGLRRMATGGMFLEPLAVGEREKLKIPANQMALLAKHVGEYGAHAAAKQAGFRKGDVLISFDGRTDFLTEAEVFRHATTERKAADRVPTKVLRNGERLELTLPMQK